MYLHNYVIYKFRNWYFFICENDIFFFLGKNYRIC